MTSQFKFIYGGFSLTEYTSEEDRAVLEVLTKHKVKDIDTARIYPGSEKLLGELKARERFTISTKAPGFQPGVLKRQSILDGIEQSLKELQVDSVDVYYFHSPDNDPNFSLSEALETIQELYKQGKFKRFGLSNFTAEDTKAIYNFNKEKGYVLPSVYQGNFNPVARHLETNLLPFLRENGFSIYAYSPMAGGFLAKTADDIRKGVGRFSRDNSIGQMYQKLYNKPTLLKALDEWESISKESGIRKAALAYRWDAYNSVLKAEHGDGIIFGGNKKQIEETLQDLEAGPLPDDVAKRISAIWETVKDEAPVDNYAS